MTFLAPFAWSLLALAAPIIALYLIKTRLRRRAVPTLIFWEQLRPPVYSNSLWRKLRRWLSLLLQIAFLALLVFALARPLASWENARAGATIIVLDPSPSMLATDVAPDRWTRALATARQRVDALRFADQTALILAEQPPRVLAPWTGSRRTLNLALDHARNAPSTNPIEGITEVLTLAHRLAAGRHGAQIVLLTDGSWNDPPPAALLAGIDTVYFGTSAPVNTALTAFSARRSLAAPGDWIVAAEAQRFGPLPVDSELEITRNGQPFDVQSLHLEPGKPWRKTWTGHADDATTFTARLRTLSAPDQLAADDTAEASLDALVPITVDLIAPPNGFLDAALGSLPSVRWHRRAGFDSSTAPPTLSVFYRAAPPPDFPATAAALLIDPPTGGFWGEPGEPLAHPLISDYEKESIPLRFVGLDSVSLQSAREFHTPAGAEIFAQTFGKPLLFGHWPADTEEGLTTRHWLVLPFDLENTDFVLRTAFPILLGNLVQSLRTEPSSVVRTLPGVTKSRLARTAPPSVNLNVSPATVRPASATVTWWSWAPLWWWAAAVGACWLLAEWWSFSRRITE